MYRIAGFVCLNLFCALERMRTNKNRINLFMAVHVYVPIISPQTLTIVRISIRWKNPLYGMCIMYMYC